MKIKKLFLLIGIFGAIQFLLFTTYAMWIYPGGTLHDSQLESYSFFTNYFSDLGRTYTFNRSANTDCHFIFKTTLTISGICILLFFTALPTFFYQTNTKRIAWVATVLGVIAGGCYIGLAWYPYNEYFWVHRYYVQAGFIAFFLMSIFYSVAIFQEKNYPNKYGKIFLVFMLILGIQILVMIFGPRSWTSERALFLQATSQKIIVYSEILVLLYQAIGLWKIENARGEF